MRSPKFNTRSMAARNAPRSPYPGSVLHTQDRVNAHDGGLQHFRRSSSALSILAQARDGTGERLVAAQRMNQCMLATASRACKLNWTRTAHGTEVTNELIVAVPAMQSPAARGRSGIRNRFSPMSRGASLPPPIMRTSGDWPIPCSTSRRRTLQGAPASEPRHHQAGLDTHASSENLARSLQNRDTEAPHGCNSGVMLSRVAMGAVG